MEDKEKLDHWVGLRVSKTEYEIYSALSVALGWPITKVIRFSAEKGRPAASAKAAGLENFDTQLSHIVDMARRIVFLADSKNES
ncbi:MAG TPA: hypothetical protein PK858_00050 [Saprospiraceae bacterium]|nr:hypothetical protein [Saprospiraceae bacterium]